MRITGGRFRGRVLATPLDDRVRPTADRVRQAVFNVLAHNEYDTGFSLEGACVADLFAGTGAMGLEAISHGAAFCLFVDDAAESRALLRRNVEALGLTGITKIWRRDATKLGPITAGAGGPFDLVFLDPPYHTNLIPAALSSLYAGGWLAADAVVIAECDRDEGEFVTAGFARIDERQYGATRMTFLRPM